MRCFISIDLPGDIRKELASIQKKLPEAKMTLVDPEIIHLTLKFLGELDDRDVSKAKESLKKARFQRFKAKLGRVGVFPDASFVRVVWVGIEPRGRIIEIHDAIDGLLGDAGFKKDKAFESHATLARVRFLKDKKDFLEKLSRVKVKPLEFMVGKISLKKSTLTSEGPIYEEVESINLI